MIDSHNGMPTQMHWRIQRGLEETCALADHARTGGVAGHSSFRGLFLDLLGGEVEGMSEVAKGTSGMRQKVQLCL